MYTGFRAHNFRCFRDLQVKGLRRVNLIAGENNVGKSALLEARRILVVEGKDDQRWFQAFLKHLRPIGEVQVLTMDGKDNLRGRIKALVNTPGFWRVTSLGVVRDADGARQSALQSVRDALAAAGLPAPTGEGVRTPGGPDVTVLILAPAGTDASRSAQTGKIEDLCLASVRDDPAMECIRTYFECLNNRGVRPRDLAKAKVQAFLASRLQPGKRIGEAAEAGYWPWESPVFGDVRRFLEEFAGG